MLYPPLCLSSSRSTNMPGPTETNVLFYRQVMAVTILAVTTAAFVPLWTKNAHVNNISIATGEHPTFASTAYDADTATFQRLKYRIDVANKWSHAKKRTRSTPTSATALKMSSDSGLNERVLLLLKKITPTIASGEENNKKLKEYTKKTNEFAKFVKETVEEEKNKLAQYIENTNKLAEFIDNTNKMAGFFEEERQNGMGTVIRTAARPNMGDKSRPGRPGYTTRKNSLPSITVNQAGVDGDYNHYRSQALASTPDRAVCILTTDVMAYVRDEERYRALQDGDLGENILVQGIGYTFFEVGKRYKFSTKKGEGGAGAGVDEVIVEIKEPAVPCANLCNLEFINNPLLEPRQRIEKCQSFVEKLGIDDGFRGWYAKVILGGTIRPGDSIALMA